jgi:hypothetical protein
MEIQKCLTNMPCEILELIFINISHSDFKNLFKIYNKKIYNVLNYKNKYFWTNKFNIDFYYIKNNKFGDNLLYVMDSMKDTYFYTCNIFKPNMNQFEYYILDKIIKSKMHDDELLHILTTRVVQKNIDMITTNFMECLYNLYEKSRSFNSKNIIDKYKYSYTILDFIKLLTNIDDLLTIYNISQDQLIPKINSNFRDLYTLYRYQQNLNN